MGPRSVKRAPGGAAEMSQGQQPCASWLHEHEHGGSELYVCQSRCVCAEHVCVFALMLYQCAAVLVLFFPPVSTSPLCMFLGPEVRKVYIG